MKIVLVRHGKPNVDMKTRISPGEMFSWIQNYDDSKVNESCPSLLLDSISLDDFFIVSSSLPRALTSLDILRVKPAMIDSVFHEAELPVSNISRPKLSLLTNVFLLRVLWLMGYEKMSNHTG